MTSPPSDAPPPPPPRRLGTPAPAPAFVRGAALSPPAPLLAWLAAQVRDGAPRLLRLPLVLRAGQVGFALGGARLGGASDAVTVRASDTALGIGLGQHALRRCKGQPTCAFWVHGYFRGEVDGELRLDVVKLESPLTPDEVAAVTHAEVEGDSAAGN
jgi:hypothetical protein